MNLNKLTASLKKINYRDKKVQSGLAILLVGAVLVGGWGKYIHMPLNDQRNRLETDVGDKERKLQTLNALTPQLDRIRAEIQAKSILLDSLRSIFPDQKEVPKLIHEITRLAAASEIHTTKFTPMTDVQQEYYVENRYQLGMWGGYHQFATFLSRLANLRLIINLSDVRLVAHPALMTVLKEIDGAEEPEHTIEASFTLTTFSSKR
jgi:Tfp pilus assembly protein PilO